MKNKIKENVDKRSIVSEILLLRSQFRGSVLLVEGESDELLYGKFVLKTECQVVNAFNRSNVEGALWILHRRNVGGVLGIVDRDYEEVSGRGGKSGNVVYTQENDAEMMIMCSPALEMVLTEYGSKGKIDEIEGKNGKSVRELVFESAACIGAVRVLSKRNGWNLRFREMRYRFSAKGSIRIDVDRQYSHLIQRSNGGRKFDLDTLKESANELLSTCETKERLCRGHDAVRVLGKGLRKEFGSKSQFDSDARAKDLERVLRLAYDSSFFEETETYLSIKDWEQCSGYRVLAMSGQ